MNMNEYGVMEFTDIFDLTYELLNQLDMEVKSDGTVYDKTNNNILAFNGMTIKASINPNDIHYANQGVEIEFNIIGNVRLATTFFGYYIQNRINNEGLPCISHYPTEIQDENGIKYTSITYKFDGDHEISSEFFHNKCLAFIQLIFLLEDQPVNLKNFDIIEEM